jgi:hypothetical protein
MDSAEPPVGRSRANSPSRTLIVTANDERTEPFSTSGGEEEAGVFLDSSRINSSLYDQYREYLSSHRLSYLWRHYLILKTVQYRTVAALWSALRSFPFSRNGNNNR